MMPTKVSRITSVFALVVLTAGCARRAPTPVPVVQAQDRQMDCAAIFAESQSNASKIRELGSEEGSKVAQNVAAGVAGLFIWPLWFAMDFQNAAAKEGAALQSRQQYLATLADQRQCAALQPNQAAAPAALAQATSKWTA
jgi:hypothetical protein